ncbi:MAG: hypothetical protein H6819_13000 [Phycisphaerales bacterium]|nr:hypothetical protein [Phycisphaerales bacterium]MCB9856751.1 hypothetical protein [Phycisphaerales bacterium]MCB9862122.1 hypothetical protein [Phycisphaerales bacterium]
MARTNHLAAGRFVARTRTHTIQGLSAEETLELIKNQGDDITELFVIHRVTPEGRLELAGINPSALSTRDCMMFSRNGVADARRDYDAFVGYANDSPPPCRVELKFGHAKSLEPPHIVILIFPTACQSAVGNWLNCAPFNPGEHAEGSTHVLESFESASPQIVLMTTLEPAPLE